MSGRDGEAEAQQADMRKYFTDPNLFVTENDKLNDCVGELRGRYDAELKLLAVPLQDLLRDRANQFKVENLSELLPRFLVRINSNAQSFLSLGGNFIRDTIDFVSDHVQKKVAHFHHAHLMIGSVMDGHLTKFASNMQGVCARVKGIEHSLGITATMATAQARPSMDNELTLIQRLTAVEAKCQELKSEVLILKLSRLRSRERDEGSRYREASPASSRATSAASSRATSLHEANQNLEVARRAGSTSDMITAAQEVAYFRRPGPDGSNDVVRR